MQNNYVSLLLKPPLAKSFPNDRLHCCSGSQIQVKALILFPLASISRLACLSTSGLSHPPQTAIRVNFLKHTLSPSLPCLNPQRFPITLQWCIAAVGNRIIQKSFLKIRKSEPFQSLRIRYVCVCQKTPQVILMTSLVKNQGNLPSPSSLQAEINASSSVLPW